MITHVDAGKVLFLSVSLTDGSMEAFHEVQDAIAHATGLVESDPRGERAIFVAVPRARVHMAVRVDPLNPPAMPVPMPVPSYTPEQSGEGAADWARSQGLAAQPNGQDRIEGTDEPEGPAIAAVA